MPVTELGVWLAGGRVAVLRRPRIGRITCRYEPAAFDSWPFNVPVLSCSLPLRTGWLDAWAFCSGLLPEGRHRQAMAALAGVPTLDVMGMLARFGRDVAGAVVVSADDPPLRNPGVEPYTDDELLQAVAELDDHPLGLYDDSELSIAGLQDKMLLVELEGGWGRPRNGYPSTHILKVDDRLRRGLVRTEHACLCLAAAAGIRAADSALLQVGDAECIAVRRFDRQRTAEGQVTRLHQEDACQALGIDPDDNQRQAKYEQYGGPTFRRVARLLEAWADDPTAELLRLLDAVTFSVLIGNADAHGKNFALLHPEPGRVELAPLYDTVPTVLWPRLRPNVAMTIGGRTSLDTIGLDDVVQEAAGWALDPIRARARAVEVAERVRQVLGDGLVDVDTPALDLIARRTEGFLSGRRTPAVSSPGTTAPRPGGRT